MIYPYASGDRLEDRNTYFYAAYGGRKFLAAWRQSRRAAGGPAAPAAEAPRSAPTDLLLRGRAPRAELDRLLQRFEVTKRLHGEYNERWRPVDETDYKPLGRYVDFAGALQAAYARTGKLQYLNAFLKCMDTLVAARARLDPAARRRLKVLAEAEQRAVARLGRSLGRLRG